MSERFVKKGYSRTYSDGISYLESQFEEEKLPHLAPVKDPSLERKLIAIEKEWSRSLKPTPSIEIAVQAFETYIQREMKMANELAKKTLTLAEKFGYSEKQLDLVKRTVAKNATDEELELFFYRCTELNLNPLMPGQVYFLKFKNKKTGEWNPGTMIVGLDGFRMRAHRTGQLSGIKRGVIRNQEGQCIGAWADVYRKDWQHPAHEEVALSEYFDQYKDNWRSMPETMIKKVAEVAAIRMAFPEELGGVYSQEEMDRKTTKEVSSEIIEEPKIVATYHPISQPKPTEAQLKELWDLAKSKSMNPEDVKYILKDYGHDTTRELNLIEYNDVMGTLRKIPSPQEKISPPLPSVTEDEMPPVEDSPFPHEELEEKQLQDVPWAKYRK